MYFKPSFPLFKVSDLQLLLLTQLIQFIANINYICSHYYYLVSEQPSYRFPVDVIKKVGMTWIYIFTKLKGCQHTQSVCFADVKHGPILTKALRYPASR